MLRAFADKPETILAAAKMHAANGRKTVVVEGDGDVRFLRQWITSSSVRTVAADGKPSVLEVSRLAKIARFDRLLCIVDVDYDVVTGKAECGFPGLIYVSYGRLPDRNDMLLEAIDLDALLFRSAALHKILCIKGIGEITEDVTKELREKIRSVCSVLGACRVACRNLADKRLVRVSPTERFDPAKAPIDHADITFNQKQLIDSFFFAVCESVPLESSYQAVEAVHEKYGGGWALCRGHDLTAVLAMFLSKTTGRRISLPEVEQSLKMAYERDMLKTTVFGKLCSSKSLL